MKRSRFRSDAAWSAAGTVLPILLGALSIPWLLHALGPEAFAAYALGFAVVSFAPTLDAGISRTTLRRMASLRGLGARAARGLVRHSLLYSAGVGLLVGAVGAILAIAVSAPPGVAADRWPAAQAAVLVALAGMPLAIVANTQRCILEGAGHFARSAWVRVLLGLLTAVVPALLTLWTREPAVLVASLVALRAVAVVHQVVVLRAVGLGGRRSRRSARGSDAPGLRGYWRESGWYALLAPISLCMSGFDRFAMMWLGGLTTAQLAAFIAPQEVALRAIILPASIVPPLLVRMAAAPDGTGQAQVLAGRLLRWMSGVVFVICAMAVVGAAALASRLFPSLDAAATANVIQVLCIGIFSNAVAQFPMTSLAARGLVRDVVLMQGLQLPVYLLALGPLLAAFGVVGAAMAWSGRIVVDTAMLIARSRVGGESPALAGWSLVHAAAVAALVGLAAWI